MGKQSSSLMYGGKVHKEIYFQVKYHDAMYKGDKLIWKKLPNANAFMFSVWHPGGSTIPTVSITLSITGNVNIDWGDGTTETATVGISHSYKNIGTYVVTIIPSTYSEISLEWNEYINEVITPFPSNLRPLTRAFYGCRYLAAIPAGLFDNHDIEDYSMMFSNCALRNIPSGLFAKSPSAKNFASVFAGGIEIFVNGSYIDVAIPENLFANCPNATNFWHAFYDYGGSSIPENLFANCPNATDFDGVFGDAQITEIPAGLFRNNEKATIMSNAFTGARSITSIPETLFANCPNVTNFDGAFMNCLGLTAVPEELFANCPNVTDFNSMFASCANLTMVPENLFANCPNVTDFGGLFSYCTSLTTVSENLFANCPNVTDFGGIFGYAGLTRFPVGIFRNCPNVTNFTHAFDRCREMEGEADPLWDRFDTPFYSRRAGENCFRDCNKLSNYSTIPDYWK